jgi:hypothetical protein
MTLVFLAMMWRNANGSFTFGFWYVAAVALLMFAAGIWSLVDPNRFEPSISTCSPASGA